MIYITADIHLNDSNILKYQQNRKIKYKNKNIMNRDIISYQNYLISNDDIVYVIGDFICGRSKKDVFDILNSLNGKIHVIIGNHDIVLREYNVINNKVFIHNSIYDIIYNNYRLYLFHYPILEQPNFYKDNTYHLYGHLHGKYKHSSNKALDVGFNVHNFKILSIDKILNFFVNNN